MSSFLVGQPSPYLIQHANQPVNWHNWSEEALKKAQADDKPIILSIGYAACHWCQEMSRDCFEDEYIAGLMNRHFVCILVDREEKPELDHLYMEAVRMFDQSAGWPLNAFCLPDGRPFWGGTYFPKEDSGSGIAPWSQVLIRISEHYRRAKHELVENAENVVANLTHSNHPDFSQEISWDNNSLGTALDKFCDLHDDLNGGFTPSPKFTSPMKIDFLLAMRETKHLRNQPEKLHRADHCINKSLKQLTLGGIYDHVSGGFFRYCTDDKWEQPHYEKMLSDNALLLSTFSKAYKLNNDKNYHRVINGTINWLNEQMGNPEKGYSSSTSAESGGIEGAAYEWTETEIEAALGKQDAQLFFKNLPASSRHNQKKLPQLFDSKTISIEQQIQWISFLKKERKTRPKSSVDNKRLIAHNSLVVSAFVQASLALNEISLLQDAIKLEKWISSEFQDDKGNLLSYTYPSNKPNAYANLDDYCFWIIAILDIFSVHPVFGLDDSYHYLKKAIQLTEHLMEKFKDLRMYGYFFTEESYSAPLPCRKKIWYDNATPSGNSMLLKVFSTLHHLTRERKWATQLHESLNGYSLQVKKIPEGISYALSSICEHANGILSIKIPKSLSIPPIKFISKFPIRPIFVRWNHDKEVNIQILNNDGVLVFSTKNPNEALAFLRE